MKTVDLKIDWCSHEAAKYAVMKWHYSKLMPVGKTVKCGVWESGKFIGCVIYSNVVGVRGAQSLGYSNFEVCELVRVALGNHETPVTRIIKITIAMLKKLCPKLEVIVSYADPEQEHLGIIYQAGNWFYMGESTPSLMYIIDGRKVHSRAANPNNSQFGRKTRGAGIRGAEKYKALPKHKYIYPLTSKARKRFQGQAKPYPKSAGSITSNALADHAKEGGASPTSALNAGRAANG